MISVPSLILEKIQAHGKKAYPEEGCGALIGKDEEDDRRYVKEAIPLKNRISESRHNRYVIDARDVTSVEKKAHDQGLELVGFFHSHPNAPALPSQFDLEHSWPWYSYVIVSVLNGNPGDIESWKLKSDRSKFDKEELVRTG